VIVSSRVRSWFADTDALSSWAGAAGTGGLAYATFELARRARDEVEAVRVEAKQVGDQVALQREQLAASSRAYVYPLVLDDWAIGKGPLSGRTKDLLPVKNAGPGLP
jgi:hypothetical protein